MKKLNVHKENGQITESRIPKLSESIDISPFTGQLSKYSFTNKTWKIAVSNWIDSRKREEEKTSVLQSQNSWWLCGLSIPANSTLI